MSEDFVPTVESELVTYTNNFAAKLAANFAAVGLVVGDSTTFATLNTAWVDAYAVANDPATRTKLTITDKDVAKDACVEKLRYYAKRIQTYSGTTDALRQDFGLPVYKTRAPRPTPIEIPVAEVSKRWGWTVEVTIHDGSGKPRKPVDVQGAYVYSFVGENFPENIDLWKNEGLTTRMRAEVQFDSTLPVGTKVWLTAAYVGFRGQVGDGCAPISAYLAGGTMNVKGSSSLGDDAQLKAA